MLACLLQSITQSRRFRIISFSQEVAPSGFSRIFCEGCVSSAGVWLDTQYRGLCGNHGETVEDYMGMSFGGIAWARLSV